MSFKVSIRQVNYYDVLKKLPEIYKVNDIKQEKVKLNLSTGAGSDSNSERFVEKSAFIDMERNTRKYYVTTKHKYFNILSNKETNKGGRCRCCLNDFAHAGLGIGFRMKMEKGELMIYVVDQNDYCSYECEYFMLINKCIPGWRHDSDRYMTALKILKIMFDMSYPGEILRECNDPRLLRQYGGPLSNTEYSKHKYIETSMIIMPCKRVYLQENETADSHILI